MQENNGEKENGGKRSSLSTPLSHIWAGRGGGCSGSGRLPCTAWAQDEMRMTMTNYDEKCDDYDKKYDKIWQKCDNYDKKCDN